MRAGLIGVSVERGLFGDARSSAEDQWPCRNQWFIDEKRTNRAPRRQRATAKSLPRAVIRQVNVP